MYHTIHLFYKLDYHTYSAVFRALKKQSEKEQTKVIMENEEIYRFEWLQRKGITIFMKRFIMNERISYRAIELIMNPIRLIKENDYIELADMRHASEINKAFKKAMTPLVREVQSDKQHRISKLKLAQLDAYSVKRVDFAINFHSEHAKQYMKLIRRAHIPEGFEIFQEYDPRGKRRVEAKHSFYLFKKSKRNKEHLLTINCYNKTHHLQDQRLPCSEMEHEVIRFEIQCHYNKVYRLIHNKDKKMEKHNHLQWLREDISSEILSYYYKRCIGCGDYYTLPEAKRIIAQNDLLKEKRKTVLVEILTFVNEKRGIWKARLDVTNKRKFDEAIQELHILGINPVTIPINWEIPRLPRLYQEIII